MGNFRGDMMIKNKREFAFNVCVAVVSLVVSILVLNSVGPEISNMIVCQKCQMQNFTGEWENLSGYSAPCDSMEDFCEPYLVNMNSIS